MTGPVTLGASALAGAPAQDGLADALVRSPFGQVDTSNNYADGRSETLLGPALADHPTTVYTKADAEPGTGVLDGDRVKRSFEESLTRLGVSHIPVYHLHDPYTITLAQATAKGGAIEALVALRDQGLVGAIGIAAGPVALMRSYVDTGAFDAVLTHNRYTLVDRRAEPLIRDAKRRGMTVFNAAPFGGGILAGSGRSAGKYAYRPASPELLAYIGRLDALCVSRGLPLAAAALHFSLTAPDVDSTVVGISSVDRLTALHNLVNTSIPDGFFDEVAALGDPPPATQD